GPARGRGLLRRRRDRPGSPRRAPLPAAARAPRRGPSGTAGYAGGRPACPAAGRESSTPEPGAAVTAAGGCAELNADGRRAAFGAGRLHRGGAEKREATGGRTHRATGRIPDSLSAAQALVRA